MRPLIFLYDDDTYIRMSYPDLIEEDGEVWITETQKDQARVHLVKPALLQALWNEKPATDIVRDGLVLELSGTGNRHSPTPMPKLPDFTDRDWHRADYGQDNLRNGFSLDLAFKLSALSTGQDSCGGGGSR